MCIYNDKLTSVVEFSSASAPKSLSPQPEQKSRILFAFKNFNMPAATISVSFFRIF